MIICAITAGADQYGKRLETSVAEQSVYPNMGQYVCYFGYQNPNRETKNYFLTAEFIYTQSFQMMALLVNVVIFAVVIRHLQDIQRDSNKNIIEKTVLFGKIFFLMICIWFNEIITSVISTSYGLNNTCPIRFVLDTPNAFFGVLLFMMVLVKPKVRRPMWNSMT